MVLFKEDEKRMKEMERAEKRAKRTPFGRWVRRLIKIVLIGALFVGFSLSLLTGLSGDNQALKKGIEDYLTQSTGLRADVGTFTYMEFFPELELDAGMIKLYGPEEATPLATVGKARFAAGFFDLMFSRRRIQILEIEDVEVAPALAAGRHLSLARVATLEDSGNGTPGFIIEGTWGDEPLSAFVAMDVEKVGSDKVYSLPDKSDFTARLGPLSAKGYIVKAAALGGLAFHFESLGTDRDTLTGTISLEKHVFHDRLVVDFAYGESRFAVDGELRDGGLAGDAGFPVLHQSDFAGLSRLFEIVAGYIPPLPLEEPVDLYGWDFALNLTAGKLYRDNVEIGSIMLPVTLKDQIARAGPLSGTYGGGQLTGALTFDARAMPVVAKTAGNLKNADYSALAGAGGPLALGWNIEAEGNSIAALRSALSGWLVAVGGQGELPAPELFGLLGVAAKAGEPDKLQLNCLLASFEINKGELEPAPLIIDTEAGLRKVKGHISLANGDGTLELEFAKPQDIKVADPDGLAGHIAGLDTAVAEPCSQYLQTTDRP